MSQTKCVGRTHFWRFQYYVLHNNKKTTAGMDVSDMSNMIVFEEIISVWTWGTILNYLIFLDQTCIWESEIRKTVCDSSSPLCMSV